MAAAVSSRVASQIILALNCGSSSLKFGVYTVSDSNRAELLCEGEAEEVGRENGKFWLKGTACSVTEQRQFPHHGAALAYALLSLQRCHLPAPGAVGHRFVHGGPHVREHVALTPEIFEHLQAAIPYAPLHTPSALAVLDAIRHKLPAVPQIVCLDTAFHRDIPDVSRFFALPYSLQTGGLERYGFHGLSLESILPQLHPMPARLVIAHLGNGCSITAIRNGKSLDTTMGLTPTGGVMMGTRCGDLDPGVMLYLQRNGYETPEGLEDLVDKQSGFLGVSGVSSDVRQLSSVRRENSQADLALRMFCYQTRKAIAGMAAALGGIDLLVFAGGIGEHSEELRQEICRGLGFMGIDGDHRVQVVQSREDEQICKITARLSRS